MRDWTSLRAGGLSLLMVGGLFVFAKLDPPDRTGGHETVVASSASAPVFINAVSPEIEGSPQIGAAFDEAAAEPVRRPPSTVDYAGFQDLTNEAASLRTTRLVSLETFLDIAAREDAIILDTRSRAAFEAGHFKGAIHLNFSDFTDEKLAAVIGDPARPVLIYCNNNFADNAPPVPTKQPPLALNIPTFINLYGYGYRNIYELADLISMDDPSGVWVTR